jgi:hypothetical protein
MGKKPRGGPGRRGSLARRVQSAVVALFAATLAWPSHACPDYPAQVPNSECATCHQDTLSGPRNGFALDWFSNCVACFATCSDCFYTDWSSCLVHDFDSDGDGFTNDEELSHASPPGQFNTLDECAVGLHRCVPEATCTLDGSNRDDYTCSCPPGSSAPGSDGRIAPGAGCLDVNECELGTHDCGANSTCSNTPAGSFDCPCDTGYFGSGHAGQGCTDVNFCDPDPCSPLVVCQSAPTGPTCSPCPLGYEGDSSLLAGCTSIDACATDGGGCSPQATCQALPGGRSCGPCPPGWVGTGLGANGCIEDVCAACSQFATCSPGASPACVCNAGFTGDGSACRDVDECAPGGSANCGEHMDCGNLFGSYLCVCAESYHFDGDACVANASAFSRFEGARWSAAALSSNGEAPEFFVRQGSAGGGESCALRSAVPHTGRRAVWPFLLLLGVAAGWRRRRPGLLLLAVAATALLGCGGDDPPAAVTSAGAGGARPDAGMGGNAGSTDNGGTMNGGSLNGGTAGLGGADGGSGGGAAVRHCSHSRECAAGEWCNPSGEACQLRDALGSAYTFQDVFEIIAALPCPSCHEPGGEADFATTSSGFGPLLFDDFELGYQHLVADGVNCQTVQHRLCVEDPRSSLLITKVFEGLSDKPESVVFNDWSAEDLQKILRWIASGARRRSGSCGNRVVDPGEQCDEGLRPAARCAYGETTCELCTERCRLAPPVAGPSCGDGVIDAAHETCDDGNALVETAAPNGGAVCGNQCTFVPGL